MCRRAHKYGPPFFLSNTINKTYNLPLFLSLDSSNITDIPILIIESIYRVCSYYVPEPCIDPKPRRTILTLHP